MKKLPSIAAALLGLAFITFGLNYFLKFMPAGGPMEEGSAGTLFFGAIAPTGFLTMVKILEILGGILVALPKTRNIGLLVLGPIVLNIIAINVFIIGGGAVFQPPVIAISFLSAYLVFAARDKFLGLLGD
jgi:putative oxidoreductase